MIAALYVQEGGCYYGLEGVDPWPESPEPPDLAWGPSNADTPLENLSKRERAATPPAFRDLLIELARSVKAPRLA